MARILIVYGTTDGHTAKVAGQLGQALRDEGHPTTVFNAVDIPDSIRPDDFDRVMVAASIHVSGYQRAVKKWVKRHAEGLNTRPTAFLSVCLGMLENDPKTDAHLERIMTRFLTKAGWSPQVRKLVAGALLWSKYRWLRKWVMRLIVAKVSLDTDTSRDREYTDWEDLFRFGRVFAIGKPAVEPRSLATRP